MLYEEYAQKIKKYARIRDVILKYKILILCVVGAAVVLSSGFLFTKGIITGGIEGATEYIYGENVNFHASALFSDISFEYSAVGSEEWSQTAPVMPGEYSVRAVSEKSFGRNGYSDELIFSIRQKKITVSIVDNTVQWRDEPRVEAQGLVRGDTIEKVDVVLSNEGLGVSDASVLTESVVIRGASGEDVSSAYVIVSESKKLEVLARKLTLRANDITKMYDGKEIVAEEYTVAEGSVAEGQMLTVLFDATGLVNVGNTDISISSAKVTEGQTDVTEFYEITCASGAATVLARPITLSADSVSKEYDGTPLALPEWYISDGSVADGHIIEIQSLESNIITPQTQTISRYITSYSLTDASGNDVRHNYDVTVGDATLTVTPRRLVIGMESASKEYDATPLEFVAPHITGGSVVEGHELVITTRTDKDIVTPQRIVDYIADFVITCDGEDVTQYYDVTVDNGTLEVTYRKLTVTTQSYTEQYGGREYVKTAFVHSQNLAHGHFIDEDSIAYTGITNVAESGKLNAVSFNIIDQFGNDATQYYDIEKKFGTLTVTPKPMSVTFRSAARQYNGDPLEFSAPVVEGVLDIHEAQFTLALGEGEQIIKPRRIERYILGVEVFDGKENVTQNYSITVNNGYLEVTRREITIATNSDSKIYSGTPLQNTGWSDEYGLNRILDGHELTDLKFSSITDAGQTANQMEKYTIIDKTNGNDDVTDCYNITWQFGILRVDPIQITVNAKPIITDYTGTNVIELIRLEDYYEVKGDMVDGHTVTVSIDKEYIDACYQAKYELTVKIIVGDKNYAEDPRNYVVTVNNSHITVQSERIFIYASDIEEYYRGEAYYAYEFLGDEIVINSSYDPAEFVVSVRFEARYYQDANVYRYVLVPTVMYGGEDVTENFTSFDNIIIIYNGDEDAKYATFDLKKIKINVTANDHQRTYNGEYIDLFDIINENGDILVQIEGNAVAVESMEVSLSELMIYAGTYDYSVDIKIIDGYGENKTHNYDIVWNYTDQGASRVIIDKIVVDVTAPDFNKEYNGLAATAEEILQISEYDKVVGETLVFLMNEEYVNVDEYKYHIHYRLDTSREYANGVLPLSNYDIRISYTDSASRRSVLTILPVEVTVYAEDITDMVYDALAVTPEDCIRVERAYEVDGEALIFKLIDFDGKLSSFIDVGEYRYTVDFIVLTNGDSDADARNNYKVTVIYTNDNEGDKNDFSYLTILKRDLYVTTGSAKFVYDGEKHEFNDVILRGLPDHYTDEVTQFIEYTYVPSLTDADSVENRITFIFKDADGNDVTYNYNIIYEKVGTLTVTPRPITVTTPTAIVEYSAERLSFKEGTFADDLVEGHELDLEESAAPQIGPDVMSEPIDNEFSVKIKAGNKDVTANYKITYNCGQIQIIPKNVYIITPDATRVYNGEALYTDPYTFIVEGVLDIHTYDASEIVVTGRRIGVGSSPNTANGTLYIKDGGYDIGYNYTVSVRHGILTVAPIELEARPYDIMSLTYNGKAHTSIGGRVLADSLNKMLAGDKVLYVSTGGSQTDAGEGASYITCVVIRSSFGYSFYSYDRDSDSWSVSTYTRTKSTAVMYVNCGGVSLRIGTDDTVSVYASSVSNTNCKQVDSYTDDAGKTSSTAIYSIKGIDGVIQVLPLEITIKCEGGSYAYYEGIKPTPTSRITHGAMISGHYLYAPVMGTLTKPGTTTVTIDPSMIQIFSHSSMSAEYDITSEVIGNYKFEIIPGTMTIY